MAAGFAAILIAIAVIPACSGVNDAAIAVLAAAAGACAPPLGVVMRTLWSGAPASHAGGRYPAFDGVAMQPPPRQGGGPPIWFGGRSEAALRRTGRLGDGWLAYVVTAEMYGAAIK